MRKGISVEVFKAEGGERRTVGARGFVDEAAPDDTPTIESRG
jgi:hypothetical protein